MYALKQEKPRQRSNRDEQKARSPMVARTNAATVRGGREQGLQRQGGVSDSLATAYATSIGPKLIEVGSPDGVTMGRLVAHVLEAVKPG